MTLCVVDIDKLSREMERCPVCAFAIKLNKWRDVTIVEGLASTLGYLKKKFKSFTYDFTKE